MESRIKSLLEKYWEGTASLDEEREVKGYFKENPSLSPLGSYFRQLDQAGGLEPSRKFNHPASSQRWWLSAAASLVIGIGIALAVVYQPAPKDEFAIEDPKEAYEMTKKALTMLSETLNEGQSYTLELKTLNEAEDAIQ